MQFRIAVVLLLLSLAAPVLTAQTEESVDSNAVPETVTTSTSTTSITITSNGVTPARRSPPPWLFLVKIAAEWGPIAFLLAAWLIGTAVHYRIVKREQDRFPATRGSRAPQTTPIIISATLFFVPAVIFIFFEIRARQELSRGLDGVIDHWNPLAQRAWITLLICFVLALIPWLFARRADTVA